MCEHIFDMFLVMGWCVPSIWKTGCGLSWLPFWWKLTWSLHLYATILHCNLFTVYLNATRLHCNLLIVQLNSTRLHCYLLTVQLHATRLHLLTFQLMAKFQQHHSIHCRPQKFAVPLWSQGELQEYFKKKTYSHFSSQWSYLKNKVMSLV